MRWEAEAPVARSIIRTNVVSMTSRRRREVDELEADADLRESSSLLCLHKPTYDLTRLLTGPGYTACVVGARNQADATQQRSHLAGFGTASIADGPRRDPLRCGIAARSGRQGGSRGAHRGIADGRNHVTQGGRVQ